MASRESSVPLIRTKLHRPSVPFDVVGRDRLFRLMDRAFEMPLTLVSAPAGYGKSVLVAQWAEHCEHPVAWLSLDEDESDLRLFLQYLVAAVHTVAEGACRATEELLQATELPPPSVLAGHLLNDFEALGQPLAIVLDDYHRIQISSPVHDLIGRLLEHPPSSVRLVLVTRRDPPLPFMSLLAGNQVAEVRLEDLRFTGGETAEFLSATAEAELAISDEALANLQQQVEGWAAGLRLVILALRHAVDPESLLGGLRGGLPQTRAYLLREALSGLSPEDRDWLLRSSILDRFCAPLLEAVCCPDGASAHPELTGRKFLDLIQRNNLFTIALDTKGEWFRYHHLFQDLLQRQLRETSSSEDIASLHLRAGEWFEAEGLIDEALKHTLAAEEFDRAVQIVERHRRDELDADRWYVIERWIDLLPEDLVQQRPGLLLARAWVALHRFHLVELLPILEQAAPLLVNDENLLGELQTLSGSLQFFLGDGERSVHFCEEASRHVAGERRLIRGHLEMFLNMARSMIGEHDMALRALEDRIREAGSSESIYVSRLIAGIAFISQTAGDLDRVKNEARRLRSVAGTRDIAYTEAIGTYMEAWADLQTFDLEQASRNFADAAQHRYILHTRVAIDALAGRALTQQLMGRPDDSEEALERLQNFALELRDPIFLPVASSCRARLALLRGDETSAVTWARSAYEAPVPMELYFWLEVPAITRARVLIAAGTRTSLNQAIDLLRAVRQMAEPRHFTNQTIETAVLLALAFEKQGHNDKGLEALRESFKLAAPHGWIRPFVEAGPAMAEMLDRQPQLGEETGFIRRVLSAFSSHVAANPVATPIVQEASPSVASSSAAPEDLTNRELDVLELLAERLQNKEIASRLCVSTHTVNYHLKSVYGKLGVGNRRQAVAAAIQKGLLRPR